MFKRVLSLIVIVSFLLTTLGPLPKAHAHSLLGLPEPGTMVNLSPAYEPVIIKGLTIHKDNPFLFDFIVDVGQDNMSGEPLKKEGEKLIKYFLASLAIPDKDLWVNLSPYEKDRMIPAALGQTDMGRDLLEQDYILKQITASLIYPEKQLGKTFWDKVYAKAQEMYGTTQVPVNTFNKVWIMADRAEVFEHNQTAFVVDQHLKVMLEEDYLALQKHSAITPSLVKEGDRGSSKDIHSLGSQIVREIILPELEKEVNTGKNFANLRQIFNSIILSSWYKKNLKEALLNQVYANKSNVNGVIASGAKQSREQIYEQYLQAYKKGVFNYIKEEVDTAGETVPRKYFSGGILGKGAAANPAMTADQEKLRAVLSDRAMVSFKTGFNVVGGLKDFYYRARQNAHKRITGRSWIPGDTSGDVVRLYDKVLSMGYPTVELSKIDKNRVRKINSQINEAVEQLRKMLDFDGRVVAPPSVEEIKASLVNTSVFHPALFEKSTLEQFGLGEDVSPTFVFDGSIFKKPNGLKQPYRIVVDLGEDITTVIVTYSYLDKYRSFKEAWSKDGLLTPDFEVEHFLVSKGGFRIIKLGKIDEGNDFDGSFEDKIEGKNTKALLPEADDLAHGMGNKGPTIGASKEGGKATAVLKRGGDLKRGIKDWVTSSILANFLGILYLTGPDMGSGDYMGLVQEQADLVHKTLGLPLIPVTTSIAGQSSSFDHMQWRVTSISAWTTFLVLWQNLWIRERYGITNHVDIVIQGFGDVGSGLVQLIHDRYSDLPGWLDGDNPIIRITSVSDINGGIDNPKGLDIGALLRLRKRLMQKESISLKRDYSSESNGEFQTFDDGKHVFYVHTPAKGEEKRSVIAFPAAGPAVFTTKEDIMRLKAAGVDMVVSPGNNTVKAGLEKHFEDENSRILLLGSDESSGGGIKTSDEELTHNSIDGGADSLERKVDREPKEWEAHITKNIEWVQTSLIKREQELFEREIREGHIITFHDIHTELAAQIRNNKNNILASPDRPFRESVVKEVEAVLVHEYGFTPAEAKRPSKLKDSIAIAVILYRTIELARVRAMYGEGLARNTRALKHMATLDWMLNHPEMEPGAEEQNAIYELGKMGWGEAREKILKIIGIEKFENVRDVSVASLNDLGRSEDLLLLHELAKDTNPSVRFAAKEAAKWIENNINGNGVPAHNTEVINEKLMNISPEEKPGILRDYLSGKIQRGAAMDLLINEWGLSMEDSGRYLDKAHGEFMERQRRHDGRDVNLAMIAPKGPVRKSDLGGIDLNTSNGMQWKVSKDGNGVEMNIDPAMLERIRREGIDSLSPVIFRITPIASIWPLVGLQAPISR